MANNAIGKAALACAWPKGTAKKKRMYPKGSPYGDFKKAINIAYPNRSSWGKQPRAGASCDVFAGTMIRVSGTDKTFPRGLKEQLKHVKKSAFLKKFTKIGKGVKKSKLKGGDIQIKSSHIRVVVDIKGTLYIAEAGYKTKRYGVIAKKAPAKSSGYTTYRSKTSGSYGSGSGSGSGSKANITTVVSATDTTVTSSTTKKYISKTIELFEDLQAFALEAKITNIYTTVQSLLINIKNISANNITYNDFDTLYYKSLINICEKELETIQNSNKSELKALMDSLQELANAYENPNILLALQETKVKSLPDNSVDTATLEEYIYKLKLYSLALRMQQDHVDSHNAYFYTDVFINDAKEPGGLQYGIIEKYTNNEQDYKSLLNDKYEELNYLTNERYAKKLNEYNQELNKVNLNINNLKNIITDKTKDYFIVQDEINRLDQDIEDIKLRISLLEKENFSDEYAYWNKNVILNPNVLNFWLEFLDTTGELSQFNIGLIGDRPKTINDTNATSIYFREIPQLIYVAPDETHDTTSFTGYTCVNIDSGLDSLFTLSAQKKSVKDVIDENLYNYAYCAEEINITAIPIYYISPGIITSIYDEKSNINGNYVINTISLPLTYNGNMTLTASKVPTRLY